MYKYLGGGQQLLFVQTEIHKQNCDRPQLVAPRLLVIFEAVDDGARDVELQLAARLVVVDPTAVAEGVDFVLLPDLPDGRALVVVVVGVWWW